MADVLTPGNPVNEASKKSVRTRSRFDLSYSFFDTHRFGEYHPHFTFNGVPDDKDVRLRSSHDLRSYTLGAPLMQDISMKKDYFYVPLPTLLPLNWEKWYKNPKLGDDVSDNVGTLVTNFWTKVSTLCSNLRATLSTCLVSSTGVFYTAGAAASLEACLRYLVFLEYFYSSGSLLKSCGISGNVYFDYNYGDFDGYFDSFIDLIITNFTDFTMTIGGVSYSVDLTGLASSDYRSFLNIHGALALMRDDLTFRISSVSFTNNHNLSTFAGAIKSALDVSNAHTFRTLDKNVNLERVFSYQIICSHFYSNDNVDFIYSADLFRQLIWSLFIASSPTVSTFTYNGVSCNYDSLSGFIFESIVGSIDQSTTYRQLFLYQGTTSTATVSKRGYFSNLFAYRRSLRYMDYFTGSRSRPLAVGNVSFDVSGLTASVVDVTQNIQKQRFLNAVSRARNAVEGYLGDIFGVGVPYDFHNPSYLGHTSDTIFGDEVQNTGSQQISLAQSITSNLRSNGSRYEFDFNCDLPCVVLGITYYDIVRAYSFATEKQNFDSNRFDTFNPFMQFIGDQEVGQYEIGDFSGSSVQSGSMAYQLRDMQYKQRYSQCAGGFVNNLPGYVFKADDSRYFGRAFTISPDFIRSLCSELDKYYVSLTGFSNGSYFHFIVKNVNNLTASRPMAYAPSIL